MGIQNVRELKGKNKRSVGGVRIHPRRSGGVRRRLLKKRLWGIGGREG